ncbi:hypothetical protein [Halopelagius longus]|uniref:Uncharacterized protein n=1 Tax=Halopelagius longus TaxID=1236180 RepID=A0A1H1DXP0_9EURY|nr:hypothetical protein [Halopelagius longus]RDI71518.1 hypothetical protein DWB78_07165 [Halopelagius longus]SDQ81254.1 hypothetical protein SAMN05216278_2636 [Halopelagius longus]
MSLKSKVFGAFGYLLLLVALVTALWGVWVVGLTLSNGATEGRLLAVLSSFGSAVTFGFFGYFVRKFVAGQVLPIDVDKSVAYRAGR